MRHVQLHLATLGIGARDLPLRYGTVTVVRRSNTDDLDWEVVAHTVNEEPIAAATHELTIAVFDEPDAEGWLTTVSFTGSAALVRRVEHVVVFRGSGALPGFEDRFLADPTD